MISVKELKGINSPFRNFSLNMKINSYKKQLTKLQISLENLLLLDAGCGRGFSTRIIIDKFSPKIIYTIVFQEEQINLAKKMHLDTEFFVVDIAKFNLISSIFDLIFVFNVLYHVPCWREAIKEVQE